MEAWTLPSAEHVVDESVPMSPRTTPIATVDYGSPDEPSYSVMEYRWQLKPGSSICVRPNDICTPITTTLSDNPAASATAYLGVDEAEAIGKALLKAVAICRANTHE